MNTKENVKRAIASKTNKFQLHYTSKSGNELNEEVKLFTPATCEVINEHNSGGVVVLFDSDTEKGYRLVKSIFPISEEGYNACASDITDFSNAYELDKLVDDIYAKYLSEKELTKGIINKLKLKAEYNEIITKASEDFENLRKNYLKENVPSFFIKEKEQIQ